MPARDLHDEYKYDSSVVNIHSTLLLPVQDFSTGAGFLYQYRIVSTTTE